MTSNNEGDGGINQSEKEDAKEISLKEAMGTLLQDEDLSDMVLKSSVDGTQVHANRCILAARSPVFRSMLFGSFSEASNSVVDVAYSGDVIWAMLNYIYANEIEIRASYTEDEEGEDDEVHTYVDNNKLARRQEANRRFVQILVSLADAANYFALPLLRRRIERMASALMQNTPSMAAALWAECEMHGPKSIFMSKLALEVIRSNPEALLKGETLAMLTSNQLQEILQDDRLKAYESTRFAILLKWSQSKNPNENYASELMSDSSITEGSANSGKCVIGGRKRQAQQMTEHLRLEYIDPIELSTKVASSGLVTSEQLSHAYKEQALAAHQNQGVSYKKSRFNPTWKSSDSVVFECTSRSSTVELLTCMELTVGQKYQWSILLEVSCDKQRGDDAWLGVANILDDNLDHNMWLGEQRAGWVYGSDGYAVHNLDHPRNYESKGGFPMYTVGSTLTFLLDLSPGSGGVLNASVNGGPMSKLFDNMLGTKRNSTTGDDDDEDNDNDAVATSDRPVSFVPAVSLTEPGRVRFLGFETPVHPTAAASITASDT